MNTQNEKKKTKTFFLLWCLSQVKHHSAQRSPDSRCRYPRRLARRRRCCRRHRRHQTTVSRGLIMLCPCRWRIWLRGWRCALRGAPWVKIWDLSKWPFPAAHGDYSNWHFFIISPWVQTKSFARLCRHLCEGTRKKFQRRHGQRWNIILRACSPSTRACVSQINIITPRLFFYFASKWYEINNERGGGE